MITHRGCLFYRLGQVVGGELNPGLKISLDLAHVHCKACYGVGRSRPAAPLLTSASANCPGRVWHLIQTEGVHQLSGSPETFFAALLNHPDCPKTLNQPAGFWHRVRPPPDLIRAFASNSGPGDSRLRSDENLRPLHGLPAAGRLAKALRPRAGQPLGSSRRCPRSWVAPSESWTKTGGTSGAMARASAR